MTTIIRGLQYGLSYSASPYLPQQTATIVMPRLPIFLLTHNPEMRFKDTASRLMSCVSVGTGDIMPLHRCAQNPMKYQQGQ